MDTQQPEISCYRRMELLQELSRNPIPTRNTTCAELDVLLGKRLVVVHPVADTMTGVFHPPDNAYIGEQSKLKAYVLTDEGKRELVRLSQEWASR